MLSPVARYYAEKIKTYGPTNKGVDWSTRESQDLRFRQLCALFSGNAFSVCDVGCGYGGMHEYLLSEGLNPKYTGIDICPEMIAEARQFTTGDFHNTHTPPGKFDYCVASGIFNVRLDESDKTWERHIHDTIDLMWKHSIKGIAFNFLTWYSDADKKRDYLYYADPAIMFDWCKARYKRVSLLHDYELYEFTMIVRK